VRAGYPAATTGGGGGGGGGGGANGLAFLLELGDRHFVR